MDRGKDQPADGAVKVTFFGVSTLLFDDGRTQILIDGFFPRPSLYQALSLLGVVSYLAMPRSEDPQFEFAAANVVVVFPGTNPEDVESLAIAPLEDAVNELDDLKKVESTIQDGIARVNVEFLSGTDPDDAYDNAYDNAYDDVVRAIDSARPALPAEVAAVEVVQVSPTDVNILQVALVSEEAAYRTLQREAERLQKRLERVGGVKRVETWA